MNRAQDGDSSTFPLTNCALTKLLPRDALQQLQDRFAALGGVTVCLATRSGRLITRPWWGSRYSEMIGTSRTGRIAFLDAIRACATSPSSEQLSACHEGMRLYPTLIVHKRQRLGVIIVGSRTEKPPGRKGVRDIAKRYGLEGDELYRNARTVDPYRGGAPEAIRQFAQVLADTIATLYAQAARIRLQLAELQTVHELSELLAATWKLQEILDRTVRRVVEVMRVKACAIRLLDVESGELLIKAVCNLSDEYLGKGPVMLGNSPIDSEAFDGRTVYIADAATDPRIRYPQNARKEGIVSGLCVPMSYDGEPIGVMRVYTDKPHRFDPSEESLVRSIASQSAAAIIHSRLWREQAEAERVKQQVRAAGEIQRRMLPRAAPRHPHLQFGSVYDPTLDVGGDLFDFIDLGHGRTAVCIADVVGKGMPAALLMASLRSSIRAVARHDADAGEVVAHVNRHLCRDTLIGEFATLVYGYFSEDGRSFTYASAGHWPPLLLRSDQVIELTSGGLVIGIQPEEEYAQESIPLRPDDLVVFVTDGVVEAIAFNGVAFGKDRLIESIHRHGSLDADQVAHEILWDVRRFVGLANQSDDITIVTTKVLA